MIGKDSNSMTKRFSDEPRVARYRQWNEVVICNRVLREKPSQSFRYGLNKTTFSTDRDVLLVGFYCGSLFQSKDIEIDEKCVTLNVAIVRKSTLLDTDGKTLQDTTEEVTFKTTEEAFIKLRRPIVIKTNFVYEILLTSKLGFSAKDYDFLKHVDAWAEEENNSRKIPGTGIVVKFPETQGIVTRLKFNIYSELKTVLEKICALSKQIS